MIDAQKWMRKELLTNDSEYLDDCNILNATLLAETYANDVLDVEEIPEEIFEAAQIECEKRTKLIGYNT